MRIPRLLFPVLLSVAGFAQTGGQVNVWIPRGPEGGVVGRPVIDPENPGTLYLPASFRLFKTTDAASHWSALGDLPDLTVLAVDPRNSNTLYGFCYPYGDGQKAPCKSTDGGLTWSAAGSSFPTVCATFALVIDPSNSSTLYAGCSGPTLNGGGGVFKSTDGAATWNAASSGLPVDQTAAFPPNVPVRALVIDPQDSNTLYALAGPAGPAGAGVFRSTDARRAGIRSTPA